MRVDFFTIPVQAGAEAAEELNRLLSSARILTVDRQFVADGESSFWSICVVSQSGPERSAPPPSSRKTRVDYRDILSPEDFAVYARLRELRKQLADREAVPPYAVFTNEQLAAIAQNRVQSLTALRQIDGIGDARVEKYGKSVVGLMDRIAHKFSDHDLLALVWRILSAHEDAPGRGLPIGALTSQVFANLYLRPAARLVMSHPLSGGYVRYMDDLIWWGSDRRAVSTVLEALRPVIEDTLKLEIKTPARIGRSRDGVSFCGVRIFPDRLMLSRRRKRRFAEARQQAEFAYARGELDAAGLQRQMDAVLAMTAGLDAAAWRRNQLARAPLAPALAEV